MMNGLFRTWVATTALRTIAAWRPSSQFDRSVARCIMSRFRDAIDNPDAVTANESFVCGLQALVELGLMPRSQFERYMHPNDGRVS